MFRDTFVVIAGDRFFGKWMQPLVKYRQIARVVIAARVNKRNREMNQIGSIIIMYSFDKFQRASLPVAIFHVVINGQSDAFDGRFEIRLTHG